MSGLFALGPVIVVGIFFLVGYLIEVTRRVAEGSYEPLPEWGGNFGLYFKEGFAAAWGVLIWLLPVPAVWVGAALSMGGSQSIAVQLVFGLGMLAGVSSLQRWLSVTSTGRLPASAPSSRRTVAAERSVTHPTTLTVAPTPSIPHEPLSDTPNRRYLDV